MTEPNFRVTIVIDVDADSREAAEAWGAKVVEAYGQVGRVEVENLDTPEARRRRMCVVRA